MNNQEINNLIDERIKEIKNVIFENLKSLKCLSKTMQRLALKDNECFTHRIFELKDLNTKLTGRKFPSFIEELRENLTPEIRKRFSKHINEVLKKDERN